MSQSASKTFYTVLLPILALITLFIGEHYFHDVLPGFTSSELGVAENVQAILMMLSTLLAFRLLYKVCKSAAPKWIVVWVVLCTLASTYIYVEEISYGQHYVGWVTPSSWAKYNDQDETNLHNTSSWLDQKPRALFEIGLIIGGILVPLMTRFGKKPLPERLAVLTPICPDPALFTTAVIATLVHVYGHALKHLPSSYAVWSRPSEIQEIYFYYFILLYLFFLLQKQKTGGLSKAV